MSILDYVIITQWTTGLISYAYTNIFTVQIALKWCQVKAENESILDYVIIYQRRAGAILRWYEQWKQEKGEAGL